MLLCKREQDSSKHSLFQEDAYRNAQPDGSDMRQRSIFGTRGRFDVFVLQILGFLLNTFRML